jgi:DNA invertase Pin-like site-specific DNA recombinase
MFVRAYLRASTSEQDANRAKDALDKFADDHGFQIAAYYAENESGASLQRPKLFELLAACKPGDALLIEQVDRLSRLKADDWNRLKAEITARKIRIIALDLPTSWAMANANTDEFTTRMFDAINGMMLDMLAAVARKDYEDRRRRQNEGIAKAQAAGAYRGRQPDADRYASIEALLTKGVSWKEIMRATKCSRGTVARVAAKAKSDAKAA